MFDFIKKTISVLALLAVLVSFASCSGSKGNIVGKWKYEMNGKYREAITEVIVDSRVYVDIYYEFNSDGTGKTYSSDGSFTQEFEYEFKGDVITITANGASFDTECSLKGNTLTITEGGESIDFIRQ